MKVLLIGGTGTISSACAQHCIELGHELHLINRGKSVRSNPEGAKSLTANYFNDDELLSVLGEATYDVVVDFLGFQKEHVVRDVEIFRDRTDQFVFISSASAYQTPPKNLPVTEQTPLENPFWQYSRDKIACENYLMERYKEESFPVTVVRPSHTYDAWSTPFPGGNLLFHRAQAGKKIILHGDGTSLWTLTHSQDFAQGFCRLLGNKNAIGEAYHITSDEYIPWNQIAESLLAAAGLDAEFIYIPSDFIVRFHEEYGSGLLGDKAHSMIFDNSKIKKAVPGFEAMILFTQGAKEIGKRYKSQNKPVDIDAELDQAMDRIISRYESILY